MTVFSAFMRKKVQPRTKYNRTNACESAQTLILKNRGTVEHKIHKSKFAFQIPEIFETYFWNDFWNASYLRGIRLAFQIPEILEKYFWNDFWNGSYLRGIRFAFQIPEIWWFESWKLGPKSRSRPQPQDSNHKISGVWNANRIPRR